LVNPAETCDLCGLKIGASPVIKTFDGGEKHFCCQGCARVYEVAHDNNMLDQLRPKPQTKSSLAQEFLLTSGQTAYFILDGMWCAGCAVTAEHVLRNQPGVKAVDVSFAAERGRLQYDPEQVNPADVLRNLDALGYQARLLTDSSEERTTRQQERIVLQLIVAAAFGMQVMLLYLVQLYPRYADGDFNSPEIRRLQYLVWALATPVLVYGGSSLLRGAWRSIRARTATMDTLVTLGTLSAYGYSIYVTLTGQGEAYFDSVSMITTFVMLGRFLESLGGAQARKEIHKLLQLQPERAWRREDQIWNQVQANLLMEGDTILIKPGERVPSDAEVLDGEGTVNEALLTGESAPVYKTPGTNLFAGTVVNDTALTARVTHPVGVTRLAQITHIVEQTLSAKPPIQRMADKASAFFTFGILSVALITALVRIGMGQTPAQAILASVAVLVVACPCALGLATPLALTVTLGRTTRAGLLVRNPTALETAAKVQRIVFDKTGTLTQGQLSVVTTGILPEATTTSGELLCLAAAVEQFSEHPIAQAIVAACTAQKPEAQEFQSLRGLGASAQVGERRVWVGSARFLDVSENSVLMPQALVHAGQGETVVWVGWDGSPAGFITLRDTLNSSAPPALAQLNTAGIHTVMLSGDTPQTTQAIAHELGIKDYEGNCPPEEKAQRIQAWQAQGENSAMVGDGVNDAPALAQADLSFTTAGGTDIAGETSDVVLTHTDLTAIPWFIMLSRRTRRIILENLGWAFAYNLVAVPLAAFGFISPMIAAATMATSSLLVVGNSLRLRR
jgi:heavy metal translocating P-type ATPase